MSLGYEANDANRSGSVDAFQLATVADNWTVDSFTRLPTKAGDVLRRLHSLPDPGRRRKFIIDYQKFDDERPTEEQLDGLYKGRLPQVLMDVALDRRLYDNFQDFHTGEYLLSVYSALTGFVYHAVTEPCTKPSHRGGSHAPWKKHVLEKIPQLWTILLDYPHLIRLDGRSNLRSDGQEDDLQGHVIDLLVSQINLSKAEGVQPPRLLNSDASHVAFLCWMSSKSKVYLANLDNVVMGSYWETCPPEDFLLWVGRAMARKTLVPEEFFDRCNAKLLSDGVVDTELFWLLNHLWRFCMNTQLKAQRGQDPRLALNVLRACQRQVCSGEDNWQWMILRQTFANVRDMLSKDPATQMQLGSAREFTHNIILLVARAVVVAATKTERRELDVLEGMVNFFSLGAETLSGMDPVNASGSSEHADFRTAVRQVWHKTHEDLQALSPSTAPFRSVVLEWWVECGEKCGVNIEASYEPTMGPSSGTRRWRKDNGCAWRECLCFGERPYHKLRVCKRCKKVMYCSIKCQTRDWKEGGHKHTCQA